MCLNPSDFLFLPTPSARRATVFPHPVDVISQFLPTPSARRATCIRLVNVKLLDISTHALREEGDAGSRESWSSSPNFYPRPPRGGRHLRGGLYVLNVIFLPTPSARRATNYHKLISL